MNLAHSNMLSQQAISQYKLIEHQLPSLTLSLRQLCDLELILNQGFYPLTGFLKQADYLSVLDHMHLTDGTIWPMPITLDVTLEFAANIQSGDEIALRDPEGLLLAILRVEEQWQPNKLREALTIYGTDDITHPGVAYLLQQTGDVYLGGKVFGISLPCHYDFTHLRHTPSELKAMAHAQGFEKIVAFQTRNPMHRAHQELTLRAAEQTGAKLLLHPVVGMTKPGDIEYYLRVRCYEHVLKTYPPQFAFLSLLPLAMRMAGPREAVWHAIIRKNYGCTHFIVGRDHAGPGKNQLNENFYDPYAAQALALAHQKAIGIEIVPFQEMVYGQKQARYYTVDEFPVNEVPLAISGTELRQRLQKNQEIPEWFSYPAVIAELRKTHPPKHQQGLTIFLTGLPSSGKTTLANALYFKLRELVDRQITMLDGDIVRTHLSRGLGFSQEDRIANITRVGFVAKEITAHRGIVICALVAPIVTARNSVRKMVEEVGGHFVECYVATPLSVCEVRDRKGLYKKARQNIIQHFTGVSDPYEVPLQAELTLDTSLLSIEASIQKILFYLHTAGLVKQIIHEKRDDYIML